MLVFMHINRGGFNNMNAEMQAQVQQLIIGVDTIWVVLTAAMILLMEGGFALLEAGFVRRKNAVSIIMKIFADIAVGALVFFLFGFALMFGKDVGGVVGSSGFMLTGDLSHITGLNITLETYWVFQCAFVIAVISIVSGAVAERIKFLAYIIFIVVMTGLIYPIAGHWVWSADGWLNKLGMVDFAGSAVIHALGGFAALAAAMVLGPRLGKFNKDRTANVVPPSNLPLASVGAFILWFGWFGFNAGSTLSATNTSIGHIAMTTLLSSAAGCVAVIAFTWFRYKKADPPMTINGALAGLVGITAGCAFVPSWAAIIIGIISGIFMVLATEWLERRNIDDPVGAFPVHGISGIIGTLAVGIFAVSEAGSKAKLGVIESGDWSLLGVQAAGLVVLCVFGFVMTWIAFKLINVFTPIRATRDEELVGLDVGIHGVPAYSGEEGFIDLEQLETRPDNLKTR
jgi:Amt family ammonium transporter